MAKENPFLPMIIFAKPINDKTITNILEKIITTASDSQNKKKRVNLVVSTAGGFTESGFMFYDVMKGLLRNISCNIIAAGEVGSMGVLMYSSASKEKRFILPHATIHLHETRWVTNDGKEFPISNPRLKKILSKSERLEMKLAQEMYVSILSKQTGTSKKKILGLMESDAQLNAKEAVKYGFACKIISTY